VDSRIVWQTDCIGCGERHWGPAVLAVSMGVATCNVCGLRPPVFYEETAYLEALSDLDWRGATGFF
jgi:hypothetical protein